MHLQIIYNMYKADLALNNLQGLMGPETKLNQTIFKHSNIHDCWITLYAFL